MRGSVSPSSRGSTSRSGHSAPAGRDLGAERRFAGAQPLAAWNVAWLARPIVRLRPFAVSARDRAAARAFPAAADPRYPAGARAPAAVGVRSRIRLGRAARVPDVPPRRPGWAGPRAVLPTHPLANGSPLSLRAAWVAHRAAASPRNQARWPKSSGPAPGSISGIEGPSLSTGGTGRDRPGGGDGRPRPRPLLGSRPPGDSISGSPGPAPVLGHSSIGDGGEGGTRCRPRSCPSISPGRVGPAGPRGRCVRLGGRSGSTGSIGRNPLPNGSSAWSRAGSRSETGSGARPNPGSGSLDQVTSWSQVRSGVSGHAEGAGSGASVSARGGSSSNGE